MVAITVILAAVIGTFVLGLGDSLEQAPQATLDAEVVDDGDDTESVEISHNGGDALVLSDISISVDSNSPDNDLGTYLSNDDGELNVGDTMTIQEEDVSNPTDEVVVRIVHEPSESIILDTEVTFSS